MAVEVLDALQPMGIQVPEQVSVAGYDDQPEVEWTRPKLTTVRQPTEAKGRLAGDFLAAANRGEDQTPVNACKGLLSSAIPPAPRPSVNRAHRAHGDAPRAC